MCRKLIAIFVLAFVVCPVVSSAEKVEGKVLVIGLDGADWNIINPLLEKGKLPNMEKVIENGDKSNITSSIPSMSPVAWTTFATGKNPGKHGIYSFLRKEGDEFVPLTSRNIDSKKLWDITSEKNLTSLVINVPMTYPPHKIKGKMISGYLSIKNTTYTYPESLQDKIEKKDYKIEALSEGFEPGKEDEFLEELNLTVEKRTEVAINLMNRTNWDLSVVVYTGLDRLQHYFWKYMDKENSKYEDAITDHYRKLDKQIGKLLNETNEDTKVIVMSDHGFGRLKGDVYLNYWLKERGYLELEKQGLLEKIGLTQQNLVTFLRDIGILQPLKDLMKFLGIYDVSESIPKPSYDKIDFEKTEAFAGNFGGGVYVTADNYEKVRDEIRQKLENLENPKTGERFFDEIYKKEEIYKGEMLERAPDLVIDSKDWDPVGFLGYRMLYSEDIEKSGKHQNRGILITDFKLKRKNASLTDVTPTILNLFGAREPGDLDGKSLLE